MLHRNIISVKGLKMKTGANSQRQLIKRLDQIRMTEPEREAAKAYLQQGEIVADLVIQAYAAMRSVAPLVERGLRAFVQARL